MYDEMTTTPAADSKVVTMDLVADKGVRAESPLHHAQLDKLAGKQPAGAGVTLRELKLAGILTLRSSHDNQAFLKACEQALGVALPLQPLTSVTAGDISICWCSPDEWRVMLPAEKAYAVECAIRNAADGHYAIVNVSGGQTVLELSGPAVREVLKRTTTIDVHPREFPVGKVVASHLVQSTGLIRRTEEDTWQLFIHRSFADYLWLWLQDASREFGLAIKS